MHDTSAEPDTVNMSAVTVQLPPHNVDHTPVVERTSLGRRTIAALAGITRGDRPDLAVACVVAGSLLISVATCSLGMVVALGQ